jgi:hypothetical protein
MSTELRKRGRPKKIVEEVQAVVHRAEKIPKVAATSTSNKLTAPKSTTTSIKAIKKSDGAGSDITETKGAIAAKQEQQKKAKTVKIPTTAEEPPSAVVQVISIEESRILTEISQARRGSTKAKNRPTRKPKPTVAPTPADVVPLLEAEAPSTASHLQPSNTLAIGLPIPTYQSTSHIMGLQQPHCLPWLPNPSTLRQAAYLSTTAQLAQKKLRSMPSLKEANRFVVTEQSSRRGPGGGAAQSQAQRAAEEARGAKGELLQPGEMPAKYKPAARRVQAIIVALPIVFVTSYMLYERCKS